MSEASCRRRVIEADAILFDLDGTLVDSVDAGLRCWRRWADEFAVDPVLLAGLVGRRSVETIANVLPAAQVAAGLARIDELEVEEAVLAMPGAAELLASLPPERWAIVTSGTARLATARIAWARLPKPRVVVTADDVTRGKPDPAPFLLAASMLGVEPSRCLVVEDAPHGVAAARAAGMAVVGIESGRRDLLGADLSADSPARLRVTGDGPLVVAISSHQDVSGPPGRSR